jgi:REP element-mobilizing transposase RayT
MTAKRPAIIGHHLIWTLYGHWLANDLRGSGSVDLHEEKFAPLGPVHHGRKPEEMQPSRGELREFYRQADPLLKFSKLWLDAAKRQALGDALGKVVAEESYTVWACAVLSNHAHMVIRRHRDDAVTMWHRFADASRLRLREEGSLAPEDPVWSSRPYKVFLRTLHEVCTRVAYVERNPQKEGLARQHFQFVQAYNNWPYHKR